MDQVISRELNTSYVNNKDFNMDLVVTVRNINGFVEAPTLKSDSINSEVFVAYFGDEIWQISAEINRYGTYQICSDKNNCIIMSWVESVTRLFEKPEQEHFVSTEDLISQRDAALLRVKELDEEHTKLGAALIDISTILGVYPVTSHHARHNLSGALTDCQNKGFDSTCNDTTLRVISQLEKVEKIIESVIGIDNSISSQNFLTENKKQLNNNKRIKLKIPCYYVNGQLRIGYMRDSKGIEHSFDSGGNIAFHINVEIDEYLLNPKTPEVIGTTNQG